MHATYSNSWTSNIATLDGVHHSTIKVKHFRFWGTIYELSDTSFTQTLLHRLINSIENIWDYCSGWHDALDYFAVEAQLAIFKQKSKIAG